MVLNQKNEIYNHENEVEYVADGLAFCYDKCVINECSQMVRRSFLGLCKLGGHLPKQVARNGMFHNQDFMITKLQLNIPISRLANGKTGKDKSLCCTIGTTGKGEFLMANKYGERRWSVPSKRAKDYASERKNKVHQHGPKEGKELTDYEAGLRSGYLQAQSDHAGLYKYKKALGEGKSKSEARTISRTIGKKK